MGLLDLVRAADEISRAPRTRRGIRSPFSGSDLQRVVWSDIFGGEQVPVTRAEAMSVPTVARGVNLLASTVAGLPLRTHRGETAITDPTWLSRTAGPQTPQHRLARTVVDLVLEGRSLWATSRGGDGSIIEALHVPAKDWQVDAEGRVVVLEQVVAEDEAVLFEGLHDGLLSFGADTIRLAKQLERTAANRAMNPVPVVELHQTTDDELTDEEVDDLLATYRRARMDPSGAVVYTPDNITLTVHGEPSDALLIAARNASAVDVARLLGVPASLLDASGIAASLKYETAQGRNLEFQDYTLDLYTTPVSARLSMDDVTPRGTRIVFDHTEFQTATPSPTGAPTED